MSSVSSSSNGHRQQKDRDGYGDGQLRSSSSSSSSRAPSSGQRAHMDWFAESQEPQQHQHHQQRTGSAAAASRHSQGPAFTTQSQSPGIPPSLSSPFARSASGPQMTFQAKPQYMSSRTSSSESAKRKDFSSSQSSQSHGSKVSEMIRRFDGAGSGQQRQPSSSSQNHPHTRPLSLSASQDALRAPSAGQERHSQSQKHQRHRLSGSTQPPALSFTTTPPASQSRPSQSRPSTSSGEASRSQTSRRSDERASPSKRPRSSQGGSRPIAPSSHEGSAQTPRSPSPALSGPATPASQKRPRTSIVIDDSPEPVAGPSRPATQRDGGTTPSKPPPASMMAAYSGGILTPKAAQTSQFQSPASARSGPESPDPLNLISPAQMAKRHRRDLSPSLSRTQSQSRSFSGLEAAMGDSLRPTSIKRRAEEIVESEQEVETRPTSSSSSSDRHAAKTLRRKRSKEEKKKLHGSLSSNGPSPIKANSFYASSSTKTPIGGGRKLNLAIAEDSFDSATEADLELPIEPLPALPTTRLSTATSASEEDSAGSKRSKKKAVAKPKKPRQQSAATRFTSSLRLALPTSYESDSMEEWEKSSDKPGGRAAAVSDDDDDDDDDDDFSIVGERRKSSQPEAALQTPNAAEAAPKPRMSTSIIKNASRAPPIRRLLDFIEDLFEAESNLPDRDAQAEELTSPADEFFVLVDGIAVVKPNKIQQLSRLIRICASSSSVVGRKAAAQTTNEEGDEEGESSRKEPSSILDIDVSELQRLCRILAQTLKVGEAVDPFSSASPATTSPQKSGGRSRRSKSASTSGPRDDDGDERMDEDGEADADAIDEDGKEDGSDLDADDEDKAQSPERKGGRAKGKGKQKASAAPSSASTTQQQHEQMGEQLSRVATSLMGVECTLALLTVDHLDRNLLSEDLIRPCFDLLRSALEQAVYPFVEACANIGALASQPLLDALVEALAPSSVKAKRGRAKKNAQPAEQSADPTGVFHGCGEYLASIFRHSCSAMSHAQKLVQKPSISLSESIIFGAIYAGMGPFFAIEPDVLSGSSEAAKANARGRKAMEALAPGMSGGIAMKSLRLPALNLLRNVFARHPDQRQWIIEELLTSLTKLPDMKKNRRHHSLRNGKPINSITALLLQLIQTTADGHRVAPQSGLGGAAGADAALEVAMASRQREEEAAQEAEEGEAGAASRPSLTRANTDYDLASTRKALEGPMQASRAIATFLMSKVSQAKVVKSSSDFSYASVIENLVSDLLTTVFLPEWPASILLLSSFCRSFSVALEDTKTSPDARGLALEHTGTIAAHLRASQLKIETLRPTEQSMAQGARSMPRSLAALERERDSGGLGDLNDSYLAVLNHLLDAEVDDQASLSASHFLVSQWGSELSASLVRTSAALDIAREAQEEDARAEVPLIELFLSELHQALLVVSKQGAKLRDGNPAANVFDARSAASYDAVAAISEQIVHTTSFAVTFDFMRELLVGSLDSQVVGNRTKALRGLSAIFAVDSSLLSEMYVREAIETRLSDESIGVREAAVGILSKYLLGQPEDIEAIYERLRERIYDAGLAVRKRTLKLLANIYRTLESDAMRVDACVRMVRCVNDEDVGIQEIAVQTLSDIWLHVNSETSAPRGSEVMSPSRHRKAADADDANVNRRSTSNDDNEDERDASANDDVSIIVSVTAAIREKPSPLEEVFRRFGKDRSDSEMKQIVDRLRFISDSIIATLDSAAEDADEAAVDSALTLTRIRTVYLVVSTNPAVLSISKAKALLPHLKGSPATAEEATVFELLLKVFRVSLPLMPKTALAFANQLEATIRPWLNNPPRHMAALQELIACYATIVRSHTDNYSLLIRTFGALLRALRAVATKLLQQSNAPVDPRSRMIMSETALLCEKADFDTLRKENPNLREEIDAAINDDSGKPINEVVYQVLLSIRDSSPAYAPHALRDVGFLFRGFPLLMIGDDGMQVMDDIFAAKMPAETEMLLRIILDFLTVDSEKRAPERAAAEAAVAASAAATGRRAKARNSEAKAVNIKELVGTTETYADSGVSSVLVQRYLEPILESARSVLNPAVQRPAFDILKFVVNQGLTHPLQCVPTLIALETLDDRILASKALHLHEHLASKHASILASRYSELIRTSFDFQVQLRRDNLQDLRGYRIDPATGCPVALLQSWYSLLRDKRQTRLDFIKAMVKMLDVDTSKAECEENKVLLARYVADNLATIDYKTVEEVLVIAAEAKRILAVTGAQVKFFGEEFLTEGGAARGGEDEDEGERSDEDDGSEEEDSGEDEESEEEEETPRKPRGGKRSKATPMDVDSDDESRTSKSLKSKKAAAPVITRGAPDVARMSIIMGTTLLLRNHLKSLYGLSEDRCNKYQLGKRQASGAAADRAAVRKDPLGRPLSFDAMPLAFDSMEQKQAAHQQIETYEDMVDDEGAMAEDPDDWEE